MLKRLLLDAERDALDQVQTSPQGSTDYFEGKLRLGPISQIKPQSRQDSELRSNDPCISADIKHRESLRLLEDLLAHLESWPSNQTHTEWISKIADHLDDPAARLVSALNVERAGGRFLPTGLGVTCLATSSGVKVRVNEEDWDRQIGGGGSRTLGEYIKDSLTSESGLSLAFQVLRADEPTL
jgi:hypothetical protein